MRPMRQLSLLVLDDAPDVVASFCEILVDCGYEVAGATSAIEARKLLRERFFDLLLLDERMPDVSGTEFFLECRGRYPGIGGIFITGNATVQSAVRALQSGALDLLEKPVKKEIL